MSSLDFDPPMKPAEHAVHGEHAASIAFFTLTGRCLANPSTTALRAWAELRTFESSTTRRNSIAPMVMANNLTVLPVAMLGASQEIASDEPVT